MKVEEPETVINHVHYELHVKNHGNLLDIIDIKRFSTLKKLIQSIVYVKRFVDIKCKRIKNNIDVLDAEEFITAKYRLIKSVQLKEFKAELFYLTTKRGSRPPLIKQLDLFLDENGIIRCKGRLQHAEIHHGAKYPFLLPKHNDFTRLVIKQAHDEVLHSGINATVAAILQNYWIPSVKQQVKSFIKGCVICRRTHGPSYFVPDPPPLPQFRAIALHPFEVTGVDFAGPFLVKTQNHVVKMYIALFTCASSRAIHLELVEDLSGHAFLQAFQRFTNRRSIPSMVISDNATNFELAAKIIRNLMKDTISYAVTKEITWKFIPKRAPWFGGFWERLIGLTKNALKKVLGKALVTHSQFHTLITDIEAVLNDRPLTTASTDIKDMHPITPSMLMIGKRLQQLPNQDIEELKDPSYGPVTIRRQHVRHVALLNHFKTRWQREYLLALRTKHQKTRGQHQTIIRKGDVVLVHNEGKRSTWKMAVVTDFIQDADGEIRVAVIKTANGITNRPIKKLYPLEVQDEEFSEESSVSQVTQRKPLTRLAAEIARRKVTQYFDPSDSE